MKITKISRTRAHKVNLGNYENIMLGSTIEAELEDGEDVEDAADDLDALLDAVLDKPVQRALKSTSDAEADNSHVWDFYEYD